MERTALPRLTVWFNAKCPICDAGIAWQRSRSALAARSSVTAYRDINMEPDALRSFGADVNDVRRRLHGLDASGRLHVGIDCMIAIWRRAPGQAWMAWLLDKPVIHWVARAGYDRFADLLFWWNRRKGRW